MLAELEAAHRLLQLRAVSLEASERRYRGLLENAHDAIWEHDLEGRITAANHAVEAMSGYSQEQLRGMDARSLVTEDSLDLASQVRDNLLSGKPLEQPYEQRLIRKNGTVAILHVNTDLITEDGRPTGFLHIARDVTRERKMQDDLNKAYQELSESHQKLKESQESLIQAEKLTSLGQLAASVAHEVNNPLSGILMYTQLLIKKLTNDSMPKQTALEYLSKMESEIIRAAKIVFNLLDFARQSPPSFQEVNINEIVNRSMELASHTAKLQHVQVVRNLDRATPMAMGDPDQLQQVFTNLILNAIQAMPDGGTVTLHTAVDGSQIKVEVQDTGHGISPENMRRLFTPFFTTKREVKGVGLGLAVAYGIVQRHKGSIEVQSKEREGSTFTVLLPHLNGLSSES